MISRVSLGALCVAAAAAQAQVITGFEAPAYSGSPAGVSMNGQNGWYTPVVIAPGSIDHLCYTYAGNALGIADNPAGCGQFMAGRSLGGTSFARAQYDIDYSATDVWVWAWDFACRYDGALPATLNLGSFSLSDNVFASGTYRQFIALNNFMSTADPTLGWKAEFNVFSGAGTSTPNQSPGPNWTNLTYNHWYRQTLTVNVVTNQVLNTTITDLTTNVTFSANPADWWLNGGSTPTLPLGRAFRCFTGGSLGNITAWDNISVRRGDSCAADFNNDGQTDFFDYLDFVSAFSEEDLAADFNGDCQVDFFDYLDFVAAFDECQ